MRFGKPISQEAASAGSSQSGGFDPWPAGEYEFMVESAEEGKSKSSGTDQLVLVLQVFDGNKKQKVWDYLGTSEKMQWKVRQFFESIGLVNEYESAQDIDPMTLEGRPGRLWLNIDPANGQYAAKNKVGRYIFENEHKSLPATRPTAPKYSPGAGGKAVDMDDEIPF